MKSYSPLRMLLVEIENNNVYVNGRPEFVNYGPTFDELKYKVNKLDFRGFKFALILSKIANCKLSYGSIFQKYHHTFGYNIKDCVKLNISSFALFSIIYFVLQMYALLFKFKIAP